MSETPPRESSASGAPCRIIDFTAERTASPPGVSDGRKLRAAGTRPGRTVLKMTGQAVRRDKNLRTVLTGKIAAPTEFVKFSAEPAHETPTYSTMPSFNSTFIAGR